MGSERVLKISFWAYLGAMTLLGSVFVTRLIEVLVS
jgi:hypothetical protein